jgi:hypothetical protein
MEGIGLCLGRGVGKTRYLLGRKKRVISLSRVCTGNCILLID